MTIIRDGNTLVNCSSLKTDQAERTGRTLASDDMTLQEGPLPRVVRLRRRADLVLFHTLVSTVLEAILAFYINQAAISSGHCARRATTCDLL